MNFRTRVHFLDGDFAGRALLFERPVPDTWRGYRIRNGVGVIDGEDGRTPVVAWRGWGLGMLEVEASGAFTLGAARLCSGGTSFIWPTEGPAIALCHRRKADTFVTLHDRPPQLNCTCGLWTASTFAHLDSVGYVRAEAVVGLIAGWGRVVEHQDGWRFERGYPLALIVQPEAFVQLLTTREGATRDDLNTVPLARVVRSLRQEYRIPVAAATADAIEPLIAGLVRDNRLPDWTRRVLPTDLRTVARSTTR